MANLGVWEWIIILVCCGVRCLSVLSGVAYLVMRNPEL